MNTLIDLIRIRKWSDNTLINYKYPTLPKTKDYLCDLFS